MPLGLPTKTIDPPAEGSRDASGVYTRVEGPREVSVENRVLGNNIPATLNSQGGNSSKLIEQFYMRT
jgi:hypothetical protein